MEKISLLLLIAKKTLIGSVIAGALGIGGVNKLFSFQETKQNEKSNFDRKSGQDIPRRGGVPGQ